MKFKVTIMVSWETNSYAYIVNKMKGYPKIGCGSITNK